MQAEALDRRRAQSVAALSIACLSFVVPVMGTVVAVVVVWWTSRSTHDESFSRILRTAAVVTAAAALLHLVGAFLLLPTDVEMDERVPPRPTGGSADSHASDRSLRGFFVE